MNYNMYSKKKNQYKPDRKLVYRVRQLIRRISEFNENTGQDEGTTRLCFSQQERQAINYLKQFLNNEKLNKPGVNKILVKQDGIGNLYGIRHAPHENYIMVGSHIDTVPNGGNFDGVVGVIAGIIALKTIPIANLNYGLISTTWRCEESSRFGVPYLGSRYAMDMLTNKHKLLKSKLKNDKLLNEYINSNIRIINSERLRAYIELHIEQGPILVQAQRKIGIVIAIAGNYRFDLEINGKPGHTGAVPMHLRDDAVRKATRAIHIIFEKTNEINYNAKPENELRVSASNIIVENGTRTRIPSNVKIEFDIRSGDLEKLKEMREFIHYLVNKHNYVLNEVNPYGIEKPVLMDGNLIDKQESILKQYKIPYLIMPSGAGHDAKILSKAGVSSGMLFIPSIDGISHAPEERSTYPGVALGVDIVMRLIEKINRERIGK